MACKQRPQLVLGPSGQSGYKEKALEAGSEEEGYQVSWVSDEVAEKQSLQCLKLGSLLKSRGKPWQS